MNKKLLLLFISAIILLTGCTDSKPIDKASIAESVTVNKNEYTFFILSSKETPEKIKVNAESFRDACGLAKQKYIPDLSLAKLELFIINEKIYNDVLREDIKYISTQSFFSPQIYITLSDINTIKDMNENKEQSEKIEEQIILLKNKNKDLNTNCLSVYNNISDKKTKEFNVPYITTQDEMRADTKKITIKNEK